MKLSIWQQFSSNHSANFTILGEFKNQTEAEKAVAEVKVILNRIANWHHLREDSEEHHEFWASGNWAHQPTNIENEIADEHNLEWLGAIDWFHNPKIDIILERFIRIRPGSRPESDGQTYEQTWWQRLS